MKPLFYLASTFCLASLLFSCNETVNSSEFKSEESASSGNYTREWEANGDISVPESDNSTIHSFTVTDGSGNSSSTPKKELIVERKLIKKADLKFETDSIERTHVLLSDAAKNLGGFISNENQSNQTYRNTSTMTIRIPSANFDQLIAICDNQGKEKFDRRNISANDVTEEFLDLSARVKTKKELEARYHELLKKAKNVEEVIQVEREIGKLREEIESAEGRLKYLADRVSLSTVRVEFYKDIERIVTVDDRPNRFVRAFIRGWKGLLSFLIGLVHIWPFLLVIAGVGIFVSRKVRKYKSTKK